MTICLVRCPSPFLIDEWTFPPLGLMAVGAGLRSRGREVIVHDDDLTDLPLRYLRYGFGPTSPEYPYALDSLRRIKEHNPRTRVVIGGPHATLHQEQCLRDGFDCVLVGDGELEADAAFMGKERLIVAEERPLDEYPFPDRTLVDLRKYSFPLRGESATTMVGSRGCPYRCGFCCKNYYRVRLNSAARLIEEIGIVHGQFDYNAIAFPEDIFILDQRRTEAVCRYLARESIIWRCLVRGDVIVRYGENFVHMMKDSGCVAIGIGIESGSDEILRTSHKGETIGAIKVAIRMFQDAGISVKGFFIVGLPGENEDTLAETEKFLDEMQLDDIDCKPFQPYPGSPIHDHRERYDIHWDDVALKDLFYKGRPGEYHGTISTSALSTERIVEAWRRLETKYKRWDSASQAKCETSA